MTDPVQATRERVPAALTIVLLVWTLAATVIRTVRWPNDFAEAHWLISYRYGFVKRGLVGEILRWGLDPFDARPTEGLLKTLAAIAFGAFLVFILFACIRIIRRADWSLPAVLAMLAFVSSPFIVMSAHLVGYFDNILLLMNAGAIVLMTRRRVWEACALQAVAVFIHEGALLFGFPVLAVTWLLVRRQRVEGRPAVPMWPLMLPVVAFGSIALAAQLFPTPYLEGSFTRYLRRFPFIGGDMDVLVPRWLGPGFLQLLSEQQRSFPARIASNGMYGLVLPSVLALLAYLFEAYRIRGVGLVALAAIAAVFAPALMHLTAWDTVRIWTFSISAAFLLTWAHALLARPASGIPWNLAWLSLVAVLLNAMLMTPLLDNLADRFTLTVRLLMYAPVIVTCLFLMWRASPRHESSPVL